MIDMKAKDPRLFYLACSIVFVIGVSGAAGWGAWIGYHALRADYASLSANYTNMKALATFNVSDIVANQAIDVPPASLTVSCAFGGCANYTQAGREDINFSLQQPTILNITLSNASDGVTALQIYFVDRYSAPYPYVANTTFQSVLVNQSYPTAYLAAMAGNMDMRVFNYGNSTFHGWLTVRGTR